MKTSYIAFFCLLVLAFLQLVNGVVGEGHTKLIVSILIAVTQATILALVFMELWHADSLTWLIAGSSLFWTMLMFLFIITDYLTRKYGVL